MGILLYPIVQKNVHDFLHSDVTHCSTVTDKHIHKLSHHCSICELTSYFPYISKFFDIPIIKYFFSRIQFISNPFLVKSYLGFIFLLRAPPTI